MTPIRPSGKDLSLKWTNNSSALVWFPLGSKDPQTATQTIRDKMEHTLVLRTFQAIRFFKDIPEFSSAVAYAYSQLATITPRLSPEYEARALFSPGGGLWIVQPGGHHYSFTRYALKRFRDNVISHKSLRTLVASRFSLSPELRDLRDLLNLNEECSGAATWKQGIPPSKIDGVREDLAPVDTRKKQETLTIEQEALLFQVHSFHHLVDAWRNGLGPKPEDGIVEKGHLAFESSAKNDVQLHFFQMKPFEGYADPSWSQKEIGQWANIQGTFHHRWMEGILDGDWKKVREADTDHANAHFCMNDADDRVKVLFSCGNGQKISQCPVNPKRYGKMTPREALPVLLDRLGL